MALHERGEAGRGLKKRKTRGGEAGVSVEEKEEYHQRKS